MASRGGDVKGSVRDYISNMRTSTVPSSNNSESNLATAITEVTPNTLAAMSFSNPNTSGRHLHLPPIRELEAYILEGATAEDNSENFLNILPDIAEALASYVRTYPEQVQAVWQNLKPTLKDIRRRNRLHSRNVARPQPPVCPKIPSSWATVHGEVIEDDYAWLRDKENPEVMKFLEAENAYSEASLENTKTLQKVLFKEFVSRLNENEESARVLLSDGWLYFTRKIPGAEYRLHCRADRNGFEEVYFDENLYAAEATEKGGSFFHLGFLRHSPDCRLIAYGVDSMGNERYQAGFKDLDTQQTLPDCIPGCYEDFEFSNCSQYAFYLQIDENERAYQLKRHRIGEDHAQDVVLYEEQDEMFCLTMTKSSNKKYLILNTAAQVTSETRILDLSNPLNDLRILFGRREKVHYSIEHHSFPDSEPDSQDYRGYFYVLTNEHSKNMQLYRIPVPAEKEWQEKYAVNGIDVVSMLEMKQVVIENRDFVLIEAFQIRARHLVVFERSNCMQNIRVVNLEPDSGLDSYHYVSFSDGPVYSIWPGSVDEEVADLSKSVLYDTNLLRFTYTSFVLPKQVIDYNMDTRQKVVVHEEQVSGPGFDPDLYTSKRVWAVGDDGTAVPISLVYRRDLLRNANQSPLPQTASFMADGGAAAASSSMGDGSDPSGLGLAQLAGTSSMGGTVGAGNPLLLHGYGAYGYCVDPIFSASRLSLLDRGFIYAVAHVRGGSDMGNGWYEEGKLAKKPNTFKDFISCAEFLIKEGYTSREKLAIYGRSAGGLLIGAVVNARPELFKAVLTEVPFVDVINTMFDSSIPWTAFEYEEWGNPEDPEICTIMQGYCPYSNIRSDQRYPNMLIVGGMNDPRVAYFEPAKWTAKLRAHVRWGNVSVDAAAAGAVDSALATPDPTFTAANAASAADEEDRVLLLKIQDAGHSGSSGQYAYLEDLAFEYAFLISMLGVQFRPVGSSQNGAGGVNYDMYWQELEHGADHDPDDDDDYTNTTTTTTTTLGRGLSALKKPPTPFQRFSDYWRKRSLRREEKRKERRSSQSKDRKSARGSKQHSRSSSAAVAASTLATGLKGLAIMRRPVDAAHSESVDDKTGGDRPASFSPGQSSEAVDENSGSLPTDGGSAGELSEANPLSTAQPPLQPLPSSHSQVAAQSSKPSRQGVAVIQGPSGSKASLRHVLYPHEEESGRVQSTGRVYNFLSKFF